MRCRPVPLLLLLAASWAGEAVPSRVPLAAVDYPHAWNAQIWLDLDDQGAATTDFPAAPGGLLRCRALRGGLLLDRNLDGRLDGRDLPVLGEGQVCTLSVPVGTRRIPYRLQVQAMDAGSGSCSLAAGTALVATVAGRRLALVDRDCNGAFDPERDGLVAEDQTGAAEAGEDEGVPFGEPRRFGRCLALGGGLYDASLAGDQLLLAPHPGPTGQAALVRSSGRPAAIGGALVLEHAEGAMWAELELDARPVLLPGRYLVTAGHLEFPIEPGGEGAGLRLDLEEGGEVELGEGGNELVLEPPRALGFSASSLKPGEAVVDALWLEDGQGRRWRADFGGAITVLWRADGREVEAAKLEYG